MLDQLTDEVALLERHLEILRYVFENEPIGIVALSNETGYAHHEVRSSLRVLEDNGVIEPTQQGAVTTDRAAEYFGEVNDTIDVAIERADGMRFQVEQAAPQEEIRTVGSSQPAQTSGGSPPNSSMSAGTTSKRSSTMP